MSFATRMSAHHLHAWYPWNPEESLDLLNLQTRCLWEIADCWELDLGPLNCWTISPPKGFDVVHFVCLFLFVFHQKMQLEAADEEIHNWSKSWEKDTWCSALTGRGYHLPPFPTLLQGSENISEKEAEWSKKCRTERNSVTCCLLHKTRVSQDELRAVAGSTVRTPIPLLKSRCLLIPSGGGESFLLRRWSLKGFPCSGAWPQVGY